MTDAGDELRSVTADVRIFVGIASNRDWKPQFGISLVKMVCETNASRLNGRLETLTVAPVIGQSNLAAGRQKLVNLAIEGGFTHLVMLDDDMQFPGDTVIRLLSHRKPFVCANACQKIPGKISGVCLDNQGGFRIDSTDRSGLEEVGYGSLAVCAIDLEWLKRVPKPHFEIMWYPHLEEGKGGYIGEDHQFLRKAASYGMRFWCDHDVRVQHIGDFPYQFGQPAPRGDPYQIADERTI